MNRRTFLRRASASAIALGILPAENKCTDDDLSVVRSEIEKRHIEAVRRLQDWVKQPSIAAENRGMSEGCDHAMGLLREAGFARVTRVATDGQPGIFATSDAGASRTVAIYFMYDVKQANPAEWSSPPWEPALVHKSGLGQVLMGRGAVNQKGPEAALLAALHAIRGVGRKLPVNLVLIAEGEEEIGSPHLRQIVGRADVQDALARCLGIFVPAAAQGLDGIVSINLGAKGWVELELTASGERWGRGPRRDIHSSNKARVDSPVWHLVNALHTLVADDGNEPAIDGFATRARPLSAAEEAMVAEGARRMDEAAAKKTLGVERWIHDISWKEALERLVSKPTVNIEGMTGGYTGPGGMTILPHKASAKLDLRLVPDMTAMEAIDALRAHLAKRGYGDIQVEMTGGYDPTTTAPNSPLVQAQIAVYRRAGFDPILWPRVAGSWPGCVFTTSPLRLSAGHFGLGHGGGAHAPDEYYVINSEDPKIAGFNRAVLSFVEYLYELARI